MMGTSPAQRLRLQAVAAEFLERMGAQIRARREELQLSRADVAREMPGKVNENQVYRWEKGRHQPNPDTLEALAKVLKCDVATFMSPPPTQTETPDLFPDETPADPESQIAALTSEVALLREQVGQLVGLLTGDPEKTAMLSDALTKALEKALSQRAREAGLPDRRLRQRPPGATRKPAA